jgi:hypothetical protein
MNASYWFAGGLVGLLLLQLATGVAAGEAGRDALPSIEGGTEAVADKKPKLKYRRGPTCMCVKGTSEEEIRQAEEKRRAERDGERQ